MKPEQRVDKNLILKYFNYNPKDGSLIDLRTNREAGGLSNSRGKLYRRVRVGGTKILCHRIIFFLMNGKFPDNFVDHINGDSLDNRWENLRECTHMDNMRNCRLRSNNNTGIFGVTWRDRGTRTVCIARITNPIGGKRENLYEGLDFFEACCRRKSAENHMKYHDNHGKRY